MSISFFQFPPSKKVITRNKLREHLLTVYFDPHCARPIITIWYKFVPITERVGGLIRMRFELMKVKEADAPDNPNIWIKIATARCLPAVAIGHIWLWQDRAS